MMDGVEERSYALISEGIQEHMTIEISTHMTEGDFLVVSQKCIFNTKQAMITLRGMAK